MRKFIVLAVVVILGLGLGVYLSTTSRANAWPPERGVAESSCGDQGTCAEACGIACGDGSRTDANVCPSQCDDQHASSDCACDDDHHADSGCACDDDHHADSGCACDGDHHADSGCACDGDRSACTDDMKASCEHLKSCDDNPI